MSGSVRKFRMKRDSTINPDVKAGDVVYDLLHHDYGLANDDTRFFHIEHTSVTLDPNGDYPFFTVPVSDLEEIKEPK